MREELLAKRNRDPFKLLGVSNEDKMSFFLLKWVFNAVKRNDQHTPYVLKKELVSQLSKNVELLNAMNIPNSLALEKGIQQAPCKTESQLTWLEFLEYFFVKEASLRDCIDHWWTKIDQDGRQIQKDHDQPHTSAQEGQINETEDERSLRRQRWLNELREVEVTP